MLLSGFAERGRNSDLCAGNHSIFFPVPGSRQSVWGSGDVFVWSIHWVKRFHADDLGGEHIALALNSSVCQIDKPTFPIFFC